VLVASHVAHFRAQLLAAFSDAGFEAVGVADGAQAEKQLTSRPTHVLVADFELPKRAGDELLARAWTQHPALHVTALVAAELPHMLVPPHDAADLVRGQPLDVPDLVARVRALLDTRSSMR
jgi:DNA-binding response OmpR family regulator